VISIWHPIVLYCRACVFSTRTYYLWCHSTYSIYMKQRLTEGADAAVVRRDAVTVEVVESRNTRCSVEADLVATGQTVTWRSTVLGHMDRGQWCPDQVLHQWSTLVDLWTTHAQRPVTQMTAGIHTSLHVGLYYKCKLSIIKPGCELWLYERPIRVLHHCLHKPTMK